MKEKIDVSRGRGAIILRLSQQYRNPHQKLPLDHMHNWARITEEFSFKYNNHSFLSHSVKNIMENPEAAE